ncbi:TIGR04104 family putative zinc finger protein [Bacillus sp. V59.32b]|uniref:TIGR04104 family putative zinc finger protein n=1 Tax=Bacillus sp. V59.32b TaxID=1758642 RepID=UPI000E3B91AB|nr:TIGR04104 family putative zinc finger protein [Bacillus sp. V59.32b]RFU69675.1 hypothetical protein D0463_02250 [Bacillus sp. V59.32b]
MAQCNNCNYKWKAKEILSLGFSKSGKKCPHCEKKQYISSETQRIFFLGYISLVFIIIFPLIIKLSDKEGSLW